MVLVYYFNFIHSNLIIIKIICNNVSFLDLLALLLLFLRDDNRAKVPECSLIKAFSRFIWQRFSAI